MYCEFLIFAASSDLSRFANFDGLYFMMPQKFVVELVVAALVEGGVTIGPIVVQLVALMHVVTQPLNVDLVTLLKLSHQANYYNPFITATGYYSSISF